MQSCCNIQPIFGTPVTSNEATALKVTRLLLLQRNDRPPRESVCCHPFAMPDISTCSSAQYSISKIEIGCAQSGGHRCKQGSVSSLWENELRLNPTPSALHMQCVTTCIIKCQKAQMQHSLLPMAAEELLREDLVNSPGLLIVNVSAAWCFPLSAITRGCFRDLTKEQMLWCNDLTATQSFQSFHFFYMKDKWH